ncbi:heme-binding protein [Microbaculum marinum]|uniref:Heme-binding protein n=1 Tax=Microbaculum marinum TaxID=1764581 RepID=A0AAW9RRQ4_9HYPH
MKRLALCIALAAGLASPSAAQDSDAVYTVKLLSLDAALTAAQAAMQSCRDEGYQTAIAVVDRSGVTQVVLRDRFAGPHTPETARRKAWTAVSFRTDTISLGEQTEAGAAWAVRGIDDVLPLGGGVLIEAGDGSLLGAIGVSGASGGAADAACAEAGLAAIEFDIAF